MHPRVAEAKVDAPLLSFLYQLTFATPYSLFSPTVDEPYQPGYLSTIVKNASQEEWTRAGVMWLEGRPSLAALIFQVNIAVRLLLEQLFLAYNVLMHI
jgi:hypothetical protein